MVAIGLALLKTIQAGELEDRVRALEQAVKGHATELRPVFDEPDDVDDFGEVA